MTVYEALKAKLGREPSNEELKADVQRIVAEGNALARDRLWPDAKTAKERARAFAREN